MFRGIRKLFRVVGSDYGAFQERGCLLIYHSICLLRVFIVYYYVDDSKTCFACPFFVGFI